MFKIINKSIEFINATDNALDRSMNNMAIDVERLAKFQVPFGKTKAKGEKGKSGTGHLKASGFHEKVAKFKYNVGFNKEYASYQEWGGDGKRVVKKYSMAGKKKFFLADSVKLVTAKAVDYYKVQIDKIRIW